MRISREFDFQASHMLPRHSGKCRELHGHDFRVLVTLEGEVDPRSNFVMDYAILKSWLKPLVDQLDHSHLNIHITYPSAENIAIWFADQILKKKFLPVGVILTEVAVSETRGTWACFAPRSDDGRAVLADDGEWQSPAELFLSKKSEGLETVQGARKLAESALALYTQYMVAAVQMGWKKE